MTYAVQNADFLTNENAWQKTSERAREVISLSILLLALKRFQSGAPPIHASELRKKLRIPSHIMNSSLNRLCDLGYLVPGEGGTIDEERDRSYQPGRPAESITLGSFKQSLESFGNNEGLDMVASIDPAIQEYLEEVISLKDCSAANRKLSEIIG